MILEFILKALLVVCLLLYTFQTCRELVVLFISMKYGLDDIVDTDELKKILEVRS
jgi:hypothetical protein